MALLVALDPCLLHNEGRRASTDHRVVDTRLARIDSILTGSDLRRPNHIGSHMHTPHSYCRMFADLSNLPFVIIYN